VYARVASFEGGDTEQLRQMAESGGTPDPPPGVKRVLLLGDDSGRRRLFITFFDSLEDMEASKERFERMGDEISEDIRGRRTAVDVYEVLFEQ
jgi:hypothetical protein